MDAAEEMWESLDAEGRLEVIMSWRELERWGTSQALDTFAYFRPIPDIWLSIISRYKALGGFPPDLAKAVDYLLDMERLERQDGAPDPVEAFLRRIGEYPEAERSEGILRMLPEILRLDRIQWIQIKPQLKGLAPCLSLADLERAYAAAHKIAPAAVPQGLSAAQESMERFGPLRCDKQGRPYPDAGNFKTILEAYPPWKGKWWWNSFSEKAMYENEEVRDKFVTELASWCGENLGMSVRGEEQLRRNILAVCQRTCRDPLREYIENLRWDGTPRLREWMARYLGAPTGETSAMVGITLCCALVARALSPGCIQRYVVILEGPENIGKSHACAILGQPWSGTLMRGMDSKEAQMALRGTWIMELPDLDAYHRSEEAAIKAFVTVTNDQYRPLYSNDKVSYPRRTVFIGTVNPEGPYLKGRTGNTRWLPIACTKIDAEGLSAARDQLYAEAKELIMQGYPWWAFVESEEIVEEREERTEENIFEPLVRDWLENRRVEHEHSGYVTMQEIMIKALRIEDPERWKDRSLVTLVGFAIHKCGWKRKRIRRGEALIWVYSR